MLNKRWKYLNNQEQTKVLQYLGFNKQFCILWGPAGVKLAKQLLVFKNMFKVKQTSKTGK